MAKRKTAKRKPKRKTSVKPQDDPLTFRKWCDEFGHGARAYVQKKSGLRWQTVHKRYRGDGVCTVDTAKRIEAATGGSVPWTSLVA